MAWKQTYSMHSVFPHLAFKTGVEILLPYYWGPASRKIPLDGVREWGFRNISKEYEDVNENNKMEEHIG